MPSLRDIIEIDDEKCDGCGLCVPACAEGALAVVDGKLRILDDARCDGAGACVGHCPTGALKVIQRAAAPFDEKFLVAHAAPKSPMLKQQPLPAAHAGHGAGGCPGSRAMSWSSPDQPAAPGASAASQPSALTQWPVQLHLLHPSAPFLRGKELLLCADCVAFAVGGFHGELLAGRSLAIACPKLDDPSGYVEKLSAMLRNNQIPALRVAIMEVPCCQGLSQMAMAAVRDAGYQGEVEVLVVSRAGEILRRSSLQKPAAAQECACCG
jgi:ferredoxin